VSAATVTPTSANDEVTITAQAVGLTLANPTGSPSEGQALTIRIKDNGTSQTIAYGSQYRALGVTLPANTTVSKTLYLGLIYNATDTKWDVVGVSLEGADPFNGNDWIDYSGSSTVVGWSSTFINCNLLYNSCWSCMDSKWNKNNSYNIIYRNRIIMILYTATKTETKTLDITNVEATNSIVYINNIVFDDVQLAQGTVEYPNLRVLELNLNDGDVVSAKDNNLVTYTIV